VVLLPDLIAADIQAKRPNLPQQACLCFARRMIDRARRAPSRACTGRAVVVLKSGSGCVLLVRNAV
jgi:hypothetical protein